MPLEVVTAVSLSTGFATIEVASFSYNPSLFIPLPQPLYLCLYHCISATASNPSWNNTRRCQCGAAEC